MAASRQRYRTRSIRGRLLCWVLCLLVTVTGCSRPPEVFADRFLAFGTVTEIQITGTNRESAQQAMETLEAEFAQMHQDWHAWRTGPLTLTNDAIRRGKPFSAPDSVLDLILQAMPLVIASEHLFDPAIGQLIALWGFHGDSREHRPPPDPGEIQRLLGERPKLTELRIRGTRIIPGNPQISLDFGAIGKGYGLDKTMQHLQDMGIHNALINSGGDLKVMGSKAETPWRIAIRHPSGKGILAYLDSQGTESFFTSGDYERYFVWQGKRYHHIIDPRSGYPATGSRSVTVIHPQALVADAAATALFIAGPQDWYRIAKKMGIQYVLLVDRQGRLHMNPGMQRRLQLLSDDHVILLSDPL